MDESNAIVHQRDKAKQIMRIIISQTQVVVRTILVRTRRLHFVMRLILTKLRRDHSAFANYLQEAYSRNYRDILRKRSRKLCRSLREHLVISCYFEASDSSQK